MIGEYGQPTYQKIFISLDTEKTGVPDADTKISMAGDTATLMSDTSLDIKMYYASVQDEKRRTPHQIRRLFPRRNPKLDGARSPRTPSS